MAAARPARSSPPRSPATRLAALPGAHPEVMDLASMARVTKLSIDLLEDKAKTTPVFAPGLDNLVSVGGSPRSGIRSAASPISSRCCSPRRAITMRVRR
ncbi:biotin-independent malonate decarboxylase subunit gamma [Sphingomonas aerolata]|uniref:biotin-independent malonate decarboxylase subunit gamma n=1 Tax=Sphingomonas aerolata TaxID=185951 RepID=UPI003A5C3239